MKTANQIYCERFSTQYPNMSITGHDGSSSDAEIRMKEEIKNAKNNLHLVLSALHAPHEAYINLNILGSTAMQATQTIHNQFGSFMVRVKGRNISELKKSIYVGCIAYPKWEDSPVCEEITSIEVEKYNIYDNKYYAI